MRKSANFAKKAWESPFLMELQLVGHLEDSHASQSSWGLGAHSSCCPGRSSCSGCSGGSGGGGGYGVAVNVVGCAYSIAGFIPGPAIGLNALQKNTCLAE